MMKKQPFIKLLELSKNVRLLSSIQALVGWDQETYMPPEAIALRSLQLEMLAELAHKGQISKPFTKALDALIDIPTGEIKDKNLSSLQIAALRQWRRDYLTAVKLPASFVKLFAKITSTASHAWKTAKQRNDFSFFAPYFEQVISLSRKKADILGYDEHPYDPLLDLYEPEAKTASLASLFERLKGDLKELLKFILVKPQANEDFLHRHCSKNQQLEFCYKILAKMGFGEEDSRLDLSVHPFCTGLHPKDTRMTTGIHPDNICFAIFSVLHEGGHGLYNKGLPSEYYGSPLCEPISLGIDESQSRWWETRIGQSYPFWEYFYPLLQQQFPQQFQEASLSDFYRAINIVKPTLIRIESDEVTYNLHIIVRFEIEKGLIEGTIKPKDVPEIWKEKIYDNLGVYPELDSEGCLQDIHWSLGCIGYFPTYTLGNLYASQFFQVFERAFPDWEKRVAKGQLDFVCEWLRTHIYQYGRQFTATELCEKISGSPLSEKPFIDYLYRKYKALYN